MKRGKENIIEHLIQKKTLIRLLSIAIPILLLSSTIASEEIKPEILIEAEHPVRQYGSQGQDYKSAARGGEVPVLDLIGSRTDKNCVGHGYNVALYTGKPSRFFFATHNLGDIFSAVDGVP